MTKICFLLLVHKDAEAIIDQANYLTNHGDFVVLHIDKNAPRELNHEVASKLSTNKNVTLVKPVKAGWGDWSLSKAALRMIDLGLSRFPEATHFYHLSGDCMPIRSRSDLVNYLETTQKDLIETADFFNDGWIKTGPHLERIRFYHFVNERKRKKLFYFLYRAQRFLGIHRKIPEELQMAIGSQWWCLRRSTVQRIRLFLLATPSIERFFKRCWIPDEIFFQTLVNSIIHENERESRPPTFLYFSDYGLPLVFSNDHYAFLIQQNSFFARKISPTALKLRERLKLRFLSSSTGGNKVETGRATLEYAIYAGRVGRRFAPAVWLRNEKLESELIVYILAAKKWHVGERLANAIAEAESTPQFGYIFEETNNLLPALGGIENNAEIRKNAPVTLLNSLTTLTEGNRIIFCIDPSTISVLQLLNASAANIRLVEFIHSYDDDYIIGHAGRIGVMRPSGSAGDNNNILHTIRENFEYESRTLGAVGIPYYRTIRPTMPAQERAKILGEAFNSAPSKFKTIANIEIED